MSNVFDILKERGFIQDVTNEEGLRKELEKPVVCYIGFDATATSLHIGSLIPIMAMMFMQKAGHKVIPLLGGGTTMVGDPSGKTEMRKMLTIEDIHKNAIPIKKQFEKYIDFSDDKAIMVNNADWLLKLNYIEFLRDIGKHFSVNRMLTAEAYKRRIETTGLSFLEFNYMLLQSYDFLYLYQNYALTVQMGGSDQWGNIIAGADLIRRVEGKEVFGMVFPLIMNASGEKMGKTAKGAIWLDEKLCSSYDFYQYWINTDDRDVKRFLALYTFLPMEEVNRLGKLEGAEINQAKKILAYETTCITHGEEAAKQAQTASASLFSSTTGDDSAVPTSEIKGERLKEGIPAFKLFLEIGLCNSSGDARRLIKQGGAYINNIKIKTFDVLITLDYVKDNTILLRAGKKRYHKIIIT